ncbi:hypothetical protein EVAR_79445_1 [Eumeta japonica]|uniref:Uncharacterized protein n=1 Tax=Eumeta variegata TaxID=151549 RepID=A0A4C2A485_EUMVA|nr:hypothetical protein EVAR_79445_1 [Eumeta japonica]
MSQKTKDIDGLRCFQKLKWRLAGHVAKLSDNRWTTKTTLLAGLSGQRKRGRPNARWANDIAKVAGVQWTRAAEDREHWSSLEEDFTFQGEESRRSLPSMDTRNLRKVISTLAAPLPLPGILWKGNNGGRFTQWQWGDGGRKYANGTLTHWMNRNSESCYSSRAVTARELW